MIKARTLKRTGKRVYDVRLRDPDGHEYSRTYPTRREAQAFEQAQQVDRRRGSWVDPRHANLTVAAVAERWLDGDSSKRASSAARDRSILSNHVLPAIGSRPVGSVTRADVQRIVNGWARTHAASTVGRMYSATRAVFGYAESAELIARNPCRNIRLPRVALVDRPTLSDDDLDRLAEALGDDQTVFMWLGVVLGLRWAEVAGLTVGAVDMLGRRLTVAAQLGRDGELGPPKSAAGRRTLAIPGWLADVLAALMARRGLTAGDGEALLFVTAEGNPLNYTNWRRRVWVPACERAGLPGLRFHDLRSLAATALIAEGVDVRTAATRMGHDPRVMLAIYARSTAAADRDAADRVGDRFRPRDGRGMVRNPDLDPRPL